MKLIFLFFILNINTTDPFSWWWMIAIIVGEALFDVIIELAKEKVNTTEPKSKFNIRFKEMQRRKKENQQ